MYTCPCGELLASSTGRPTRRHLHCAQCGKPMHVSPTSLPQGEATCRPCRRLKPKRSVVGVRANYRTPCIECGSPSYGQRCWGCRYSDAQGPDQEKRRLVYLRRAERERQAPGLTRVERVHLLAKWLRQGRACSYCPALAEGIDHVMPLALGGTNYEGNLTPACGACNSRKNDSLLIEWRHKKRTHRPRLAVDVSHIPRRERKPKQYKPKQLPVLHPCTICAELTHNLTCSKPCADERIRRCMRDLYRKRNGLTWDHRKPSAPWIRAQQGWPIAA